MLEANEVIKRLCYLQTKVSAHIGHNHAADCFCGTGGFWSTKFYGGTYDKGYRNDGLSLKYIEKAVQEKINKEKQKATAKKRIKKTAKRRRVI